MVQSGEVIIEEILQHNDFTMVHAHLDKLLERQMNNQLLISITLHTQSRVTNE